MNIIEKVIQTVKVLSFIFFEIKMIILKRTLKVIIEIHIDSFKKKTNC